LPPASSPVTLDDVLRASAAVGDRLHRTPMFSSATLSRQTGARVFLKAELFQRTGSFKPRGLLAKLASLTPEERSRGVVTVSAGNAAAAVAYGSALEGIDALVCMWQGASAPKVAAVQGYGGTVDQEAADPTEAFARAAEVAARDGRTFVHPFDDDTVIAGHGSLGLELVEDRPNVEVVVCPIGGGGLISGVSVGVKGARPDARIVGIEPEGSDVMRRALEAGKPVSITPVSVADGLNAPHAGTRCLLVCQALLDDLRLVTEAEIEAGFRFLYQRAKLAVEPAAAAGVGALLAGKIPDVEGKTVVVIVSGGNVAGQTAADILGRDEG
jgi:threonine dehydratase